MSSDVMGSDERARLIARASTVNTKLRWGIRLTIEVLCPTSTATIAVFSVSLEASVAKVVKRGRSHPKVQGVYDGDIWK